MIRNILFDLGGVIVTLAPGEAERRFAATGIDTAIYMNKYAQKGFFRDLETGAIGEEEFCRQMANATGRGHVSIEEARHCWLGYLAGVRPEVPAHLLELRRRYHVCLLSNTSSFVMDVMRSPAFSGDGRPIGDYFDSQFCSYELHAYKPDTEFFTRALAMDGMEPEECVFVDDSARNIRAAEALGIHGIHVDTNADWWPQLEQFLERKQ